MKTKLGKIKLADGKPVGGRNRLTDSAIDKIQRYYGLAIRNNTNSLQMMKKAVWAIYFHLISCNDKPLHGLCPSSPDSWCKYKEAAHSGDQYNHDDHHHLPEAIMIRMKDIFKHLAKSDLLQKCLDGNTQNVNESVNNVIWTRIPKRVFVQLNTLSFGIYEAVSCFNRGNITKCLILSELGIKPGNE